MAYLDLIINYHNTAMHYHPKPQTRIFFLDALVTALIHYFLEKKTRIKPELDERGLYTLYMPRFYNIMGYSCLAIGAVFPIAAITVDKSGPAISLLFLICFLMFFAFGVLSILFYRNHRVYFDNTYIEVSNCMGKTKATRWIDLASAKFDINSSMIILKDHNGEKLGVQQHLVGLAYFLQLLEAKKGWSAADLKMN